MHGKTTTSKQCIGDLSSPELTAGQLIGVPEMAELGGIRARRGP
ncbi:hypothetical protein OKJ48_09880 [Streptomyces kunmingensis]|uniref:Uncharacterized protein n=1 Tax=Streptomyces kunmingensis TaxID=68225 RepID=A0ABU6C7H5_9ACTN|nr:hypothetical protein [Streptomyces kunmingensis]MEB3960553.1 hypothetical protein [Streptomyces kunmingensis]